MDGSQLVIVNKGDALWIAYRSYGKGLRYVDIVRKNTGDIDNPDLIYPNQILLYRDRRCKLDGPRC